MAIVIVEKEGVRIDKQLVTYDQIDHALLALSELARLKGWFGLLGPRSACLEAREEIKSIVELCV